mgnify:FL=1
MSEENEEFEREMNYKSPSQVEGDLVAREFADGQEDDDGLLTIKYKYITVLDFETGRVFQYEIESEWNGHADYSDYEKFITDSGHKLNNCEWMVHNDSKIWADHSVGQVIMKECY